MCLKNHVNYSIGKFATQVYTAFYCILNLTILQGFLHKAPTQQKNRHYQRLHHKNWAQGLEKIRLKII